MLLYVTVPYVTQLLEISYPMYFLIFCTKHCLKYPICSKYPVENTCKSVIFNFLHENVFEISGIRNIGFWLY